MKVNKLLLIIALLLSKSTAFAVTKHLRIKNAPIDNGTIMGFINSRLEPLNLDLEIELVNDHVMDGNDIELIFTDAECPGTDQYGTREFTFYQNGPVVGPYQTVYPYSVQVIKIYIDCLPLDDINRYYATYNVFSHEILCHALTGDTSHLGYIRGKMPKPLCSKSLSTDKHYWTYNDQRRLLEAFGKHGRTMYFTEEDIGKTCYLIYQNEDKSVSFPITSTEMRVDWLLKNKKKIRRIIK